MKKNQKKLIKNILSIIAAVLGLGVVTFFTNVELHKLDNNKIEIKQNNGVVVGENNGVIKNYTMGGGTTRTNDIKDKSVDNIIEYEPTYINTEDTIIQGNNLMLEGIIIKEYSYQMQDISFETLFGTDKYNITFGVDHPVGYKLIADTDGVGHYLNIDSSLCMTTIFDERNDIQEGATIQISPYDFDSDGVNELIICITNGIAGLCAVFSYTHVEDVEKINPFIQELCVETQENVILDGNSLQIIIGTHGIIDREYKYVDEHFMVSTR